MEESLPIIVLNSTSSKDHAQNLARIVLEKKLCACVHIHGPIKSHYTWKSQLQEAEEFSLRFKTLSHLEKKLYQCIKDQHPYDCPEIMSITPSHVDETYKQWMHETCQKQKIL